MRETFRFLKPIQEAAGESDLEPTSFGEMVDIDVSNSTNAEAANKPDFVTPTEPDTYIGDKPANESSEAVQSEDDYAAAWGEVPANLEQLPGAEPVTEEIVGEVPSYPEQIKDSLDLSEQVQQPEQNQNAENPLELEVKDMEHALKIGEAKEKIAELRKRLDQVNRAVQLGRMSNDEGDREYENLTADLKKLEEVKNTPSPSEQAKLEANKGAEPTPVPETVEKPNASPESQAEKVEYLRLKLEFKQSQREYLDVLKSDYAKRGIEDKLLGLGRGSMYPEVQKAYDKFMSANQAYYKFAEASGAYQQIAERLNKNRSPEEQTTLQAAVAGRHVLRPAEERLKIQTMQMPEGLKKLKDNLIEKIKAHPNVAMALGGALIVKSAIFSMPALLAGIGTRMIGGKIGDSLDSSRLDKKNAITAKMGTEVDLENLEAEYFSKLNLVQKVRTGTRWAAVGAGLAAGGFSAAAHAGEAVGGATVPGAESLPTDYTGAIPPQTDVPVVVEAPIVPIENIFTPQPGQNLSTALLHSIQEQIHNGTLKLPSGVNENDLANNMYRAFPEMTSAENVSPRLTPDEWVKLGVSSGDPNNIQVGEPINLQTLIDKMWSAPGGNAEPGVAAEAVPDTSAAQIVVEAPQSAAHEAVPNNHDIKAGETREFISTPNTQAPAPIYEAVKQVDTHGVNAEQPPAPVHEAVAAMHPSNVAEQISRRELLADRYSMSPKSWEMFEMSHGYRPKFTPELFQRTLQADSAISTKEFSSYLYRQAAEAFQRGEINLPAKVTNYFIHNPTAINAFIDRNASEFATEVNPFLSGKQALELSTDQWKELGFSSGDPHKFMPGDRIQMGKLVKLILENAAKHINH